MRPVNAYQVGRLVAVAVLAGLASGATAEGFRPVESADRFLALTEGRELRRFGIRLSVIPDGRIEGRAFGSAVTGTWNWQGDFFCRELSWSGGVLAHDCQQVEVNGDTMRFTANRGAGDQAELTLR
jgi:hypothetical protein